MSSLKRLTLILLVALVASCAACATAGRSTVPTQQDRTLMVWNGTGTHIKVYIDGFKIGTATAGKNCLSMPPALPGGQVEVRFDATGWPPVSIQENIRSHDHWRVKFDSPYPRGMVYDVLSLMPDRSGGCVRKKV